MALVAIAGVGGPWRFLCSFDQIIGVVAVNRGRMFAIEASLVSLEAKRLGGRAWVAYKASVLQA